MSRAVTLDWFAEARSEDLPTQLRLINRLREGLPFSELALLIRKVNMSQEEAATALHIPSRTLARRKETSGRLAIGEGERVFRFARILNLASDTLGSLEKAKVWMQKENRALGGVTPMSLLDTDIGAQAVQDVLGRIEHGIFS
ncbi:MAG: hypothetical protein H6Q00_1602 [Holophagaceae bacterium]|nr:hypothetical protein [Holophagaceae bacterium]